MIDAATVCARLVALARSGHSVRSALSHIGDLCGDDLSRRVANRSRLGAPLESSVGPWESTFGKDHERFVAVLASGERGGAAWSCALEDLARSIEQSSAARRAAEASGSGAAMSARLIAALPLLMVPVAIKQLSDPVVAVCIGVGLLAGWCGYRWLMRMIPTPAPDPIAAQVADEAAALVSAGSSVDAALRAALGPHPHLAHVTARARLGMRWTDALASELPAVALALADAHRMGQPVAASLRGCAASLRLAEKQAFDRDVQRAPVKMVIPLVCCVLPSFILVAIVPLLRGLAQAA